MSDTRQMKPDGTIRQDSSSSPSRRRRTRGESLLLMLVDVLCVGLLYFGALRWRYEFAYAEYFNALACITIILTTIFTVYLVDGYQVRRNPQDMRYYCEYMIAGIFNLLGALTIIYFITDTAAARAIVGTTLLVFPVVSALYRYQVFYRLHRSQGKRIIVVIGVGEPACELYESLQKQNWPQELHYFDPSGKRNNQHLIEGNEDSPIIRSDVLNELSNNKDDIETIILAAGPSEIPGALVEWLVARHYLELHVQTLDNFYTSMWKIEPLTRVSPYWAFEDGFRLNQSYSFEQGKRIFDITVALIAVLVTLPVWIIIAIAIKVESAGPVFFKQERVGLGQSIFRIFKFRSMVVNAEKGDAYTRTNDKRITRVGAIIRKTRLDELPQLINVLKGEMSIIGPRPEWVKLANQYQRQVPYYHFRHIVKPGITGWAQVNYPYGESQQDAIEKLKYDFYYVRYFSFLLDLTICLKTIYVMIFGKGR